MMKKIILLIGATLMFSQVFSQTPRILEWSIGEPQITCGTTVQICYPLLVSINDDSQSPYLGTSTMRIFFDSKLLENISIQNVEPGYSAQTPTTYDPVFGGIFGFSTDAGHFAQFNIIDGAASSPIILSASTPVHVLDFCFEVASDATYPLCSPIVFDNNHLGKGLGIAEDDGYLMNDAGIVGTYLLNGNLGNAILADDEVIHYKWTDNGNAFDGTANALDDRTGNTITTDCLVNPCQVEICDGIDNDGDGDIDEGFDADSDGIADCFDNCPNRANPGQEPDGDCDGVPTSEDCDDNDANNTNSNVNDADCDGVPTNEDCDDNDPNVGSNANDKDCDGVPTSEDCDDNDANNTNSNVNDADCDGVPTNEDCDDNDPNVGSNANDKDCDGVPTSEDCDDNDANNTNSNVNDADCDGVPTNEDCDDNDPNVGSNANDKDCDGVPTSEDCDDNDANNTNSNVNDADCDGVPTNEDCDDNDPNVGSNANDKDCDGVPTSEDCDDNDANNTNSNVNDADCDGVPTNEDCDDNDPNVGSNANDKDCDGVPTSEDCDDNDANNTNSNVNDADCDGVPTNEDCDDNDPNVGSNANDKDCDGVPTSEDCDDNDANNTNSNVNDADCDGVPTNEDCDDNDPNVGSNANDKDCDGVPTSEDCDDNDANNTNSNVNDADCDGVPTNEDCDDNDPNVGSNANDKDCDGVPTSEDCDDNDANNTNSNVNDADCDGVPTNEDCDDNDPNVGSNANDKDCDGVPTSEDCDDNDANNTNSNVNDADCDGVPTNEDCDDNDPNVGSNANDKDCDGVPTSEDCDDNDANNTNSNVNDADCDGVPTNEDCDDNDPNVGSNANDKDCDGVPTSEDCDDNDANNTNSNVNDADCDGVPTNEDCDDNDPNVGSNANDKDCDGVPTSEDCDDNDANNTNSNVNDADCDGVPTNEDCDDNDPNVGSNANDKDCDGVPTSEDCDDNDANNTNSNVNDADCDGVPTNEDCDDNDPNIGSGSNDAGEDKSIEVCEGTIVDLTTLTTVSGGTFSYSGNALNGSDFDTTGLSEGNYEIIYTVCGGSCPDDTAIITVTVIDDIIERECNVIDANFCNSDGLPYYDFYWWETNGTFGNGFFSSDATHKLTFTEYNDNTAIIRGSTKRGDCILELYIVLKDKKDWGTWSDPSNGGSFKEEGCSQAVKEDLSYYLIDGEKSYAVATGGSCAGTGEFKITQRPDPNDSNTPNLGVVVGPGGALHDSNVGADGAAGWGWMGPENDTRKYKIDFNFLLDCEEKTDCTPTEIPNCETSCIERYSNSIIDLLLGLSIDIDQQDISDLSTLTVSELIVVLTDLAEDEGLSNVSLNSGLLLLEGLINDSELSTLTIQGEIANLLASSGISAEDAAVVSNLNSCLSALTTDNGLPTDATVGNLLLELLNVLSDYVAEENIGSLSVNSGLNLLNSLAIQNGYDNSTVFDLFGYLLTLEVNLSDNDRIILNNIYTCIISSCGDMPSSNDAGEDNSIEVCEGTIVDLTTLTTVSGGTFSYPGNALNGSDFDTTGLSEGNYEITYTVSNGGNCPDDTAIITITVIEDIIERECNVIDANYCNSDGLPYYDFYWWETNGTFGNGFFSSDATHKLTFTEYNDNTAIIRGSTKRGDCILELYIVLKDKKDWAAWSDPSNGGSFKEEGCSQAVKENLSYYLIDGEKSYAVATGGSCAGTGEFKITQRPDPNDTNTPNLGVVVGPGGALYDDNIGADGAAGWGWMGPENDDRRYKIDFNFLLDCEEKTGCTLPEALDCEIGQDVKNESCHDENDGSATVLVNGGTAPYTYEWSNGETTMTAIGLGSGENNVIVTDANGAKSYCSVTITEPDISIDVSLKVLLGGAYNPNTGLMFDYLRASGLISIYSPYLDGITANPLIFDITGNNAIVDWVWIEIRDSNRIDVIDAVSALIQADGDIVGIDGVSPLNFAIPQGDYHIMISHRNHLGVITAHALSFTYCLNIDLDLTVDIDLIYGGLNGANDMGDGRIALYSGDCDGDGQIQNSDKVDIQALLGTSGLSDADLDMNGQVQNSDIQNQLNPYLGKGFQSGTSSRAVNLRLFAKRNKKKKN